MRANWSGLTLEPLDYDLVWLGAGDTGARPPLGAFADVHLVEEPVRRLVSGYLMLAAPDGAGTFTISSHGHPVGSIAAGSAAAGGTVMTVGLTGEVRVDGGVVRSSAGVALVADAGTAVRTTAGGVRLQGASGTGCGATLVHGPAAVKVENRMRLLAALEQVGGRRG